MTFSNELDRVMRETYELVRPISETADQIEIAGIIAAGSVAGFLRNKNHGRDEIKCKAAVEEPVALDVLILSGRGGELGEYYQTSDCSGIPDELLRTTVADVAMLSYHVAEDEWEQRGRLTGHRSSGSMYYLHAVPDTESAVLIRDRLLGFKQSEAEPSRYLQDAGIEAAKYQAELDGEDPDTPEVELRGLSVRMMELIKAPLEIIRGAELHAVQRDIAVASLGPCACERFRSMFEV